MTVEHLTQRKFKTLKEKIEAAQLLVREQLQGATSDACVTSSFQAEDVVVLHLATRVFPEIPVLFLDTGYHFAETYEYRDRIAREWNLNLENLLPRLTVAEQESQFGNSESNAHPISAAACEKSSLSLRVLNGFRFGSPAFAASNRRRGLTENSRCVYVADRQAVKQSQSTR